MPHTGIHPRNEGRRHSFLAFAYLTILLGTRAGVAWPDVKSTWAPTLSQEVCPPPHMPAQHDIQRTSIARPPYRVLPHGGWARILHQVISKLIGQQITLPPMPLRQTFTCGPTCAAHSIKGNNISHNHLHGARHTHRKPKAVPASGLPLRLTPTSCTVHEPARSPRAHKTLTRAATRLFPCRQLANNAHPPLRSQAISYPRKSPSCARAQSITHGSSLHVHKASNKCHGLQAFPDLQSASP